VQSNPYLVDATVGIGRQKADSGIIKNVFKYVPALMHCFRYKRNRTLVLQAK